jgi:hypothetical protein
MKHAEKRCLFNKCLLALKNEMLKRGFFFAVKNSGAVDLNPVVEILKAHGEAVEVDRLKGSYRMHKKRSSHYIDLAEDIDLFDSLYSYLPSGKEHAQFGEFWKTLNPMCTWFPHDPNHYSFEEGKK